MLNSFVHSAHLGGELIDWHLLKGAASQYRSYRGAKNWPRHRFEGEGEGVVSQVRYVDSSVWINPTQHFTECAGGTYGIMK